ncbi:MAG TPA: hypothetical protein VHJ38_10470 [Nitrososphaeraceae archaeon]|jgi:hypothetical protein|nr:hypothetical protein [Nitrososphaeraceae archaeon]
MSTNTSINENSRNTSEPFSFKYVESGGLANNYLVISFDSESNNLKVSTDISGANLTQKPIEDSEKNTLIDTIKKNNFYNTDATYVTEKEDEDNTALSSSLTVTLGNDIHTAVWTTKSKDVPQGLIEITKEITNIAHGKKMI